MGLTWRGVRGRAHLERGEGWGHLERGWWTGPMLLCCGMCCLGEGILSEVDGAVYEGSFHDNKRHGEGMQVYR